MEPIPQPGTPKPSSWASRCADTESAIEAGAIADGRTGAEGDAQSGRAGQAVCLQREKTPAEQTEPLLSGTACSGADSSGRAGRNDIFSSTVSGTKKAEQVSVADPGHRW